LAPDARNRQTSPFVENLAEKLFESIIYVYKALAIVEFTDIFTEGKNYYNNKKQELTDS
jgi:hypothetical protein